MLTVLHLPPFKWTYSSGTALYALAMVDIWQWTPLIMLIALAGLASLPQEPYEAALIDGASTLQSFWHITLPLLRPALVVAILFRAIDAIKTFDIIFIMTQGGPANSSRPSTSCSSTRPSPTSTWATRRRWRWRSSRS